MKKLTALLFLVSGMQLQADVIYSNFGSSPQAAFDLSNGNAVASGGADFSLSFAFIPSISYQLGAIDFAAYRVDGTADNSVTATIYSDNGGIPGTPVYTTGAILDQLQLRGSTTEFFETVANGPILAGGATYWLSLDAPITDTVGWSYNGQQLNGLSAANFGQGFVSSSRDQGAFEIDGTVAAPEPVTTGLFASGLAALALLGRKRYV
jgi:hypothetical protein